jgi:hypothetical protein
MHGEAMRNFAAAHEDLRDFHRRRYQAFAAAFGVDLDRPPEPKPPMPTWMAEWHRAQPPHSVRPLEHPVWWRQWPEDVHRFALSADEQARGLHGPFAGYLERPPALGALGARFGNGIEDPLRVARARIATLISEVIVCLYPEPARRSITADELRMAGFDPDSHRPDPFDHW